MKPIGGIRKASGVFVMPGNLKPQEQPASAQKCRPVVDEGDIAEQVRGMLDFLGRKETARRLGVDDITLRRWESRDPEKRTAIPTWAWRTLEIWTADRLVPERYRNPVKRAA